jgi:peptidoglycan/xylan/chitin deacetylase (PgdA/CDA1 family)
VSTGSENPSGSSSTATESNGVGSSTDESGPNVKGVIGAAGSGAGTGANAGASAGAAGAPAQPQADAGGQTPADGTGSTGPVGAGPSGLPAPPGANNVARPAGAVPTDITILNWAGFKGAVTYSFDDNNQSQIQNYDTLNALGVPFTFYMWTGKQGNTQSNPVWARALADGHEIGNHTKSHDGVNNCTSADIQAATQFIQSNLKVTPLTMAAPSGLICFKTAEAGLFFINRGTGPAQPVMPGVNDNSDALNLNCYIPQPGQQTAVFNGNVNDGRSKGGWVIYVVHGFTGDTTAFQPVDVGQLTAAIQYTKSLGDMWIGRMVDVGSYWLGQKSFARAMRTMNGNAMTWTWTLPGQFPKGKFLRATVSGGTLTQNGTVLTWDPHGYYEIALDAGSVTLSP